VNRIMVGVGTGVLIVAVALMAVLLLSAYGAVGGSPLRTTPVALTTAAPDSRLPMECLKNAGLLDVMMKADGDWRGLKIEPFFVVQVVRFPSPAAAHALAENALAHEIVGASGGIYSVTGPQFGVDDHGVVAAVAACLRD
jgi:hypothetical protein